MKKQEAIKELNTKKDENENVFELEDWDTGLKCGARGAYENAINIVKQIDEPEKPVVPQFVADWYEDNKRDFENQIYALCVRFYDDALSEDLYKWFVNPKNEPVQTLVRMKFYGYEIEKEKLYEVFLKKTDTKLGIITPNYEDKSQFTDEELKEYGFDNSDMYEVGEVNNDDSIDY